MTLDSGSSNAIATFYQVWEGNIMMPKSSMCKSPQSGDMVACMEKGLSQVSRGGPMSSPRS